MAVNGNDGGQAEIWKNKKRTARGIVRKLKCKTPV